MKKIIYKGLFLAVLFSLGSCNKDFLDFEDIKENATHSRYQPRSAGDGGYDLLGYGYDIQGAFADAAYAKAKVIDVDKLALLSPNRVENGIIGKQYSTFLSGENYRSYKQSLSQKVETSFSVESLFSSSLNWAFNGEYSGSDTYSYASYDLNIQRRRLTIYADEQELTDNYLTDIFKDDYQTLTPQALVKRYGTFVLRDISLGGKLSVAYRSYITESNKKEVVESGISLGIKKIFNISTNHSYSASYANKNRQAILSYRTIGGDPSRALTASVDVNGNTSPINISNWQNSVSLRNAQLIDIGREGLIPLYELIPDYEKRYDLIKYMIGDNQTAVDKILDYAIPVYKLPADLPKAEVVKKGNKIDIYVPEQSVTNPNVKIAFNIVGIPLNADGSFSLTDIKGGVVASHEGGLPYYADISKLEGKLTSTPSGHQLTFTVEGKQLYQKKTTFRIMNVDLSIYKTEKYTGVLGPVRLGTQSVDRIENQIVEIEHIRPNKINLRIKPFQAYELMPGKFSVEINGVTLNSDGTFYADIQNSRSLLEGKVFLQKPWYMGGNQNFDIKTIKGNIKGNQLKLKFESTIKIMYNNLTLDVKYNGNN